jgi:hypothetical protein
MFHEKIDLTAHNAGILQASNVPDFLYRRIRRPIAPTFSGVEPRGVFSQDKRTYGFALTAFRQPVLVFFSLNALILTNAELPSMMSEFCKRA